MKATAVLKQKGGLEGMQLKLLRVDPVVSLRQVQQQTTLLLPELIKCGLVRVLIGLCNALLGDRKAILAPLQQPPTPQKEGTSSFTLVCCTTKHLGDDAPFAL